MNYPTVFVLGAGASFEFELPLGGTLSGNVRNELMQEVHDEDCLGRGGPLHTAVRALSSSSAKIIRASEIIRAGIGYHPSIDEFLSTSDSEIVVGLAKLAMAECLLKAENSSQHMMSLASDRIDTRALGAIQIGKTWLGLLFKFLTARLKSNEWERGFENVRFLVFNYDRCLELYLLTAFMDCFALSMDEAVAALATIPIIHVYGSLGSLPPLAPDSGVAFGDLLADRAKIASGIKTYGEDGAGVIPEKAIADTIDWAERLVFLGYGFHEQGLKLMFPNGMRQDQRAWGTTKALSEEAKGRHADFFQKNRTHWIACDAFEFVGRQLREVDVAS